MVQFTWRGQQPCGTSQRTTLLGRGVRSTAVRCFKSNSDDYGAKASTTLRLNFKIPYRVNFGQSLGLVGSGESLGNWDPKRTVQMKWTDGDWWTVEVSVPPGGSVDLEYKYVVVNSDGNIGYWKPGSNYRVTLSSTPSGTKVPKRVKVADAWDDSFKKVDVEEAEVHLAASSTGSSSSSAGSSNGVPPALANLPGHQESTPQPAAAASVKQPAATAGPSAPGGASIPAAVATPLPPAAALPAAPAAQPLAAAPQVPPAAQSGGSMNGVPANAPLAGPQQPPAAQQAPQPPPAPPPPPAPDPANGVKRSQNRAASPRTAPPSFTAVTAIPALHPALIVEQKQLEDGVRNSLEDLQMQMDKHQQLREKTDEAKLAAAEAMAARLANVVEELTKEVASLRKQTAELRDLLMSACELLSALLREPQGQPRQEVVQQFVLAQARAFAPPGEPSEGLVPTPSSAAAPNDAEQSPLFHAGGQAASRDGPAVKRAGETGPEKGRVVDVPRAQRPSSFVTTTSDGVRKPDAKPAAQRLTTSDGVRRAVAECTKTVRTPGQAANRPEQPSVFAADVGSQAASFALEPTQVPSSARPTTVLRVRSAARVVAFPAKSSKAQVAAMGDAQAKAASGGPVACVPVVVGVSKGAVEGARGEFSVGPYLDSSSANGSKMPACVTLLSVKRQGTWVEVVPPRQVTPLEFVQEGGLRGKNWKASIRVEARGSPGEPIGEYLQRHGQVQHAE